jgi:hypothetical protein
MRDLALVAVLSVSVCGCVSEAERYAWNRTHPHLCFNARALTEADIDEVARVVAHATPQTIMAISASRSLQKLDVTACYRGATKQDSPTRNVFGYCMLERAGSTWKVVKVSTDLDPALAFAMACDRPADQGPNQTLQPTPSRRMKRLKDEL